MARRTPCSRLKLSDETLLDLLNEFKRRRGKFPRAGKNSWVKDDLALCDELGIPNVSTVQNRFRRLSKAWQAADARAGYHAPRGVGQRFADEELLDLMIAVRRSLGDWPRTSQHSLRWKDQERFPVELPAIKTYQQRFGSLATARALAEQREKATRSQRAALLESPEIQLLASTRTRQEETRPVHEEMLTQAAAIVNPGLAMKLFWARAIRMMFPARPAQALAAAPVQLAPLNATDAPKAAEAPYEIRGVKLLRKPWKSYERKEIEEFIAKIAFVDDGRAPSAAEAPWLPTLIRHVWGEKYSEFVEGIPGVRLRGQGRSYTDEELLRRLYRVKLLTGEYPTVARGGDWTARFAPAVKRAKLPNMTTYLRRFGSLQVARDAAERLFSGDGSDRPTAA